MTTGRKIRRILVLDADMVSALTIARSLAARHYSVDVASAQEAPLAAYSNAVSNCYQYPDPLLTEGQFLKWLQDHLQAKAYDLVIPVTERSLIPLAGRREAFQHTRLAMADNDSLRLVLDKAETFRLAERIGVSTPQSVYISDIGELPDVLHRLSYPVVIKPSHSVSGANEGYSKRNVSYAGNESSLYSQCEACLQHSSVILQAYFQGLGAGIELIAKRGEVLYAFQHIRLHEVPLTGGGSSFRVSAELDPVLLDAASRLIREIRWTGVAMVEFKWNPDSGEYRLMEINGRFWGSLPLAVAAGADFPAMQAELSLTGELGAYPPYRRGVYCRNLGSDLMWLELVLRSSRDEVTQPPSIGAALRDLAKVFSPKHHFDTQSLADPLPGLIEIKRLAMQYLQRVTGVLSESWFTVRQRLLWHNGTVREKLLASKTILFICYGNINRSALAQALMTTQLPPSCRLEMCSAGFHEEENRPPDPRMLEVATSHGLDMADYRSRLVDAELLSGSDIIFVMEKHHYDQLREIDPHIGNRTFMLGAGLEGSLVADAAIPDPYNQAEQVYRGCYNMIQLAVARLAKEWSEINVNS